MTTFDKLVLDHPTLWRNEQLLLHFEAIIFEVAHLKKELCKLQDDTTTEGKARYNRLDERLNALEIYRYKFYSAIARRMSVKNWEA